MGKSSNILRRRGRVISAAAGALLIAPAAAPATMPTATGTAVSMPIAGSGYSLWIPSINPQRGNVTDINVFFHGDAATVRNNLAYSNLNTVLVTVNLGEVSSAYQTPYTNASLFQNVLNEARDILRARPEFDDALVYDKVAVSSFSAGWAAVREILKSPSYYNMISNYAAADTIYASYANGSTPPPSASQMANFVSFAQAAENGTKTMVLTHSKVLTSGYCNTEQVADYMLGQIGVSASAYTTPGTNAMPFYRYANSGNFSMYGATGANGTAHTYHLQQIGQFFSEMSLSSNNATIANGEVRTTDVGVSSGLAYTGTTAGATISGMVQLPRQGGDHNFNIANGTAASDLTISSRIWGPGGALVKIGAGTMTLSGGTSNTYSGQTRVDGGVLELNKTAGVAAVAGNLAAYNGGTVKWLQSNQVADAATLTIHAAPGASVADLNGKIETVAAVSMTTGTLALGAGTLNVTGGITTNLVLSAANITGSGLLTAASLNVQGNLTRSGGGVTKLTTSGLTIAANRRLNLMNTKLITPASLATVTAMITSGRNGGAWSGSGIVTSMTDATSANALTSLGVATASTVGKTTLGGVTVSPSDTLVLYTWTGDANLSETVDGDDYFYIDNGFAQQLTGWRNGDFNYSGNIDADDYFLIDRNYAQLVAPPNAAPPVGVTAVPEPSALVVLPFLMMRRQKRRSKPIRT